tara:strand:- start:56 stop:1027 length:972 start_codon:yes stop_codon:yes gene_type:complete
MNPKIMKRPMFRMGGSARPGYQDSNYADLVKQIRKDLSDRTARRDEYLRGVKSVLPLSVLSQTSGLGSIRKPMDVINLLSEIGTNPATFAALMKSKSIDMKMDEGALKDKLALAKLIKPTGSLGQKVYEMKKTDLAAINKKIKAIREGKVEGDISELEEQKKLIYGGVETEADIRAAISDAYFEQNQSYPSKEYVDRQVEKRKAALGLATGGRVGFQEGTPNPEFTMPEPKPKEAVQDRQLDTLMKAAPTLEDPNQAKSMSEGDMYAALRRRLPQEITDDVVRLIAYNPEAFADFADIQDQSDVDSFNQKYNVQLVLPVENVT